MQIISFDQKLVQSELKCCPLNPIVPLILASLNVSHYLINRHIKLKGNKLRHCGQDDEQTRGKSMFYQVTYRVEPTGIISKK